MRETFKNQSWFSRFARATARMSGRPATFAVAAGVVVVWAITGPLFGFSDTWQLVINTGTTIVTFLMVFLIQNTQNRDSEAVHVKLDELIRANEAAHNALLDLEDLDEEELDRIREDYEKLAETARAALEEVDELKEASAVGRGTGREEVNASNRRGSEDSVRRPRAARSPLSRRSAPTTDTGDAAPHRKVEADRVASGSKPTDRPSTVTVA